MVAPGVTGVAGITFPDGSMTGKLFQDKQSVTLARVSVARLNALAGSAQPAKEADAQDGEAPAPQVLPLSWSVSPPYTSPGPGR